MNAPAVVTMLAGLGPQELVLIVAVILLLFGAKKLPELARGSGRAIRIFRTETRELGEADEGPDANPDEAG